ncbi:alpha/beta fold hydrolase [Acrocarpospora catenulata]|uniref:alpha/beta fold hydrolase n=1 Tax=Acrocarpospora catenulata TaxID=2836182 RepID=UPI001BDB0E83|nr:alpha/beta fold hydrolase [Acrocarpospora catenulata]
MNDLAELKNFVVAHARSQGMPPEHSAAILDRIRDDGNGTPGSWVREWSDEGDRLAGEGRALEANAHYIMARFPFADGSARQQAAARSRAAFNRWRADIPAVQPLEVTTQEGRIRAWTVGLDAADPRPLLVMTGGIISVKEQWAPVLPQLDALGFAGIVTEMPRVGENTVPYDGDGWRMFPALLDAVEGRADTARTYLLALSFSGHLGLRAALHDDRIRGVVGAGTPLYHFFTDEAWQRRVPRVTTETLAHLAGVDAAKVYPLIRDWALTPGELSALRVPVAHVTSLRDEIIPSGDAALLREHVRGVRVLEHDDVHGAPSSFGQTRLWTLLSILRMHGGFAAERTALTKEFSRLRYAGKQPS